MICNAGFGLLRNGRRDAARSMQRMMDVNFMGTFYGARAALPIFRAQQSGHLILISSIVGQRGIAQMSGYSATKAAQAGFRRVPARGVRRLRHPCLCGLPVSTETEFRHAMERDFGHSVSGLGPKQSMDDVARAIVACVRRPRPEVYPHRLSKALAVINAIAPCSPTGSSEVRPPPESRVAAVTMPDRTSTPRRHCASACRTPAAAR